MKQELTKREALLIELTHALSYGSDKYLGMSLPEIFNLLEQKIKSKDNKTILELIDSDNRKTLEELIKLLS